MKRAAIIAKVHDPRCNTVATKVINILQNNDVDVAVESHLNRHLGDDVDVRSGEPAVILQEADFAIVLGGDGTLIGAARDLGYRDIPILAVNLGSLGFLTEVQIEEVEDALMSCIKGGFETINRMRLNALVYRDNKLIETHHVLNDVVINKGALARIVDMTAFVDGEFLTLYKADGLIISTPTGSTGYSLSAGGPIICPHLECISITPICPHLLSNRPIIIGADSQIEIMITSEIDESVYLTLDGQIGINLQTNDCIRVRASKRVTSIVRSEERDYFEILRNKLKWNER